MQARVLAGFPGADLGAYATRLMRQSPPDRNWALLAVGALQDLGLDRAALDAEWGDRVGLLSLPMACDCCISGPVLAVSLGRLMRTGSWDELIVLADARGHLEALSRTLADALPRALPPSRAPAWAAPLALMTPAQQVLLTDPRRAGHDAARALLRWAGPGRVLVGNP
jgi:hypothetical protein